MKKYLLILFGLPVHSLLAQTPEDALRFSWYPQNGTARNMAIGGAMGSLGGDLTSTFVNPAGLAFYRTADLVLTPGFLMKSNKINYRDMHSESKKNSMNFGPSGFVLGAALDKHGRQSVALSLAITQNASFNNLVQYTGLNNYSSFSEQFAEEFAQSGLSIDDVLNINSPLPYGAAPALFSYLIDTVRSGSGVIVRALPEDILDAGFALKQDMYRRTTGGLYEAAIGLALNDRDRWHFGATIGMPLVNYNSKTIFKESDTAAISNFNFRSFTYEDNLKTTGVGANLKLGVIYRPQEYIRLGIAVHTPSFMWLTDERSTVLTTKGSYPLIDTIVRSASFTNNVPGENKYVQMSPWRAMVSGSYVFREIENVKRQRAFITADIEYVHHQGSRFMTVREDGPDTKSYYKSLNKVLKNEYKGTFNFRLGGEVKFNIIMARLGFAYYTNPYKKELGLKANKMLLSGGLGYRHKGFFIDLTYVHQVSKDVNFPYRLADRANTYASLKQTQGNVVATLGWKLW